MTPLPIPLTWLLVSFRHSNGVLSLSRCSVRFSLDGAVFLVVEVCDDHD